MFAVRMTREKPLPPLSSSAHGGAQSWIDHKKNLLYIGLFETLWPPPRLEKTYSFSPPLSSDTTTRVKWFFPHPSSSFSQRDSIFFSVLPLHLAHSFFLNLPFAYRARSFFLGGCRSIRVDRYLEFIPIPSDPLWNRQVTRDRNVNFASFWTTRIRNQESSALGSKYDSCIPSRIPPPRTPNVIFQASVNARNGRTRSAPL